MFSLVGVESCAYSSSDGGGGSNGCLPCLRTQTGAGKGLRSSHKPQVAGRVRVVARDTPAGRVVTCEIVKWPRKLPLKVGQLKVEKVTRPQAKTQAARGATAQTWFNRPPRLR